MLVLDRPVQFYDGQSATLQAGKLSLIENEIQLKARSAPYQPISLSDVKIVSAPGAEALRLCLRDEPEFQILITDEIMLSALQARAKEIGRRGLLSEEKRSDLIRWSAVFIAIVAVGWAFLTVLPGFIANLIPQKTWENLGASYRETLFSNEELCESNEGNKALEAMLTRLVPTDEIRSQLKVVVADTEMVNAFALPGKHLVILNGLLQSSDSPDEVAAVLAHEIGHSELSHTEHGFIRSQGISLLINIISGGSTVGDLAGMGVLMSYSRSAEREADAYSHQMMLNANIDPRALATFFEKLQKKEEASGLEWLNDAFSYLSTHPDLSERIASTPEIADDTVFTPALTETEWQALKDICKASGKGTKEKRPH